MPRKKPETFGSGFKKLSFYYFTDIVVSFCPIPAVRPVMPVDGECCRHFPPRSIDL